jgi:predicted transcriptional regulator
MEYISEPIKPEEIIRLSEEAGLSRSKLAYRGGLYPSMITNIANGKANNINLSTYRKLIQGYNDYIKDQRAKFGGK